MAAVIDNLLPLVKQNLIVEHDEDDSLITQNIKAALSYAEKYQHKRPKYYNTRNMSDATRQAVIMLSSHYYESRDGSTAGFFNDKIGSAESVWEAVNRLLRGDKDVLV